MSEHNTEAVQAAAEAILPALAKVGRPDSSGEWSWLRSLAFDAACVAVDAATPHILAAARKVITEDQAREIMQATVAEGMRPVIDAELAKAEAVIRADERTRLYAELGNDHYVIFTEDRFTVEHSVECKLSGHMHECAYHDAIRLIADEYDPGRLGRWRITGISEGLPDLERAEREPG